MRASVWAYPTGHERAEKAAASRRKEDDAVLLVMLEATGKSLAQWAALLGWRDRNGEPAKYRVQRAIQRLENGNLVRKLREQWRLTTSGKKEAERLKDGAE
jgi:hypothetical protein